jgi:predicted aconitase
MSTIRVSEADVRHLLGEFKSDGSPQAILIGCPHAVQIPARTILSLSESKPDLPVFVFTSRRVKRKLERAGLLSRLRARGVNVLADACIMWCGLRALGYRSVITNSVKGAHYLRNQMGIDAELRPLSDLAG